MLCVAIAIHALTASEVPCHHVLPLLKCGLLAAIHGLLFKSAHDFFPDFTLI